jgi:hypothetical protein
MGFSYKILGKTRDFPPHKLSTNSTSADIYYSDSLYSLALPPCPTNKDKENVVIKIACNIFALLSLVLYSVYTVTTVNCHKLSQ